MSTLTWVCLLVGATWLLDPQHVMRELHRDTPAVLLALEQTAAMVATADALTAPIRWGLGHAPVRARARATLERAAVEANEALAESRVALGPGPSAEGRPGGIEAAVEATAAALTRALAGSVPSAPPEVRTTSSQAVGNDADVWRQIDRTLTILTDTRRGIVGLALWQLFYLLVEIGLALGLLAALRAWGLSGAGPGPGVAPTPLVRQDRWVSVAAHTMDARLHPDLGAIGRFLKGQGLPQTLAFEIDRSFRRHRQWPGSLKGHDARPGGLRRHSLRVGRRMAEQAKAESKDLRRAAAFLGIVHDLGKTVTYQPSGRGWTGHPASPHDSLSARIVGALPAFRRAFPESVRRAILQALRDYHSPEAFATNAPPLAIRLLQWLQEGDAKAIEPASDVRPEARPA